MDKTLNKNELSDSKRYLAFVNNNDGHYVKNDLDITKNNVVKYYTSLTNDEKKKISTYDLNIYYYFLNNMFKKYISNKERILQIIDTSISLDDRHKAFEKMCN